VPPSCTATDDELADWEKFFDSDDLGMPEALAGILDAKEAKADAAKPVVGACYGCGIKLQVEWPSQLGYVDPEMYWTKRQHKQQNNLLCTRCAPTPLLFIRLLSAAQHTQCSSRLPRRRHLSKRISVCRHIVVAHAHICTHFLQPGRSAQLPMQAPPVSAGAKR
jgi:hypothetical protein